MDPRQCLLNKRLAQLEERLKGLDINTRLYVLIKEERDKVAMALEQYDIESIDEALGINTYDYNDTDFDF